MLSYLQEEQAMWEEVLDAVVSSIGTVLKMRGEGAMPHVDTVAESLGKLLQAGATPGERRAAVCVLDDILQHAPQGAFIETDP